MLNALAAPTYDPLGHVWLEVTDDSSFGEMARRTNRIATLDGGVVVNDGGYSSGDRVFQLAWLLEDTVQHEGVARLLQLYARLIVSTRDGVFLVAPERYAPRVREATLRLLVIEKLSI